MEEGEYMIVHVVHKINIYQFLTVTAVVKVVTLSFQTLFSKSYNQLKEKINYMYCALYTESVADVLTWRT